MKVCQSVRRPRSLRFGFIKQSRSLIAASIELVHPRDDFGDETTRNAGADDHGDATEGFTVSASA